MKGSREIQKEIMRVLRRWKEEAGRDVSWSNGGKNGGWGQEEQESSLAGMGQGKKMGNTVRSSWHSRAVHLGLDQDPALASPNGGI